MTIPLKPKKLINKRVLVVDDSLDICFLWRRIFERQGAEVQAVESAEQALQVLKTYEPDLIVSDLTMPEHDGFELIQRLNRLNLKRANGAKVLVLAVSGQDAPELRGKSLEAGFSGYVLKPVSAGDPVDSAVSLLETEDRPALS